MQRLSVYTQQLNQAGNKGGRREEKGFLSCKSEYVNGDKGEDKYTYLHERNKKIDNSEGTTKGKDVLEIYDSRTGSTYQININNNSIKASDLQQIKNNKGEKLRSYDPGYTNTCVCTSKISYIDGENGILRYRGFPIEQLATHSNFNEVAFLLFFGELPTAEQLAYFSRSLMFYADVPQGIKDLIHSFRYDSHPMGILMATLAALGTYNPSTNPAVNGDSVYIHKEVKNREMIKVLAQTTVIAANIYRHREGMSFVDLSNPSCFSSSSSLNLKMQMNITESFLRLIDFNSNNQNCFPINSKLLRVLDTLFVLHAEHELNCSTAACRHMASAKSDVYTALASAIGALYGPRHGGANEAVIKMLEKIKTVDNIPQFIQNVKQKKEKLMGFGHRVYKSYDPRAKIVKKLADEVFEMIGVNQPLLHVAVKLEQIALHDEYFKKRNLYPNVDFYSGLIYKALGFHSDFFPVLFALPRTVGWLTHWREFEEDTENKIVRPFQIYKGFNLREYIPLSKRSVIVHNSELITEKTAAEGRRDMHMQ